MISLYYMLRITFLIYLFDRSTNWLDTAKQLAIMNSGKMMSINIERMPSNAAIIHGAKAGSGTLSGAAIQHDSPPSNRVTRSQNKKK